MATKYYGIKDNWTDDDVANVIEVASEDGSVSSVKVNGVEYGGGGGDNLLKTTVIYVNSTGSDLSIGDITDAISMVLYYDGEGFSSGGNPNFITSKTIPANENLQAVFYYNYPDVDNSPYFSFTKSTYAYQTSNSSNIDITDGVYFLEIMALDIAQSSAFTINITLA